MYRSALNLVLVLILSASLSSAQPAGSTDGSELYEFLDAYVESLPDEEREKFDREIRGALDAHFGQSILTTGSIAANGEGTTSPAPAPMAAASTLQIAQGSAGTTAQMQQVTTQFDSGELSIEVLGGEPCPDTSAASQGQQLRLTGAGFDSAAPVEIDFLCCDGFLSQLGPVVADAFGNIDATVAVPSGFPTPAFAGISVYGPSPVSNVRRALDGDILVGPTSPTDGDSDSFADFCDNCPSVANGSQADGDADEVGDVCDTCPGDFRNDADGDGLCADDPLETCPFDPNNDVDSDGVCGDVDNCPNTPNADQADSDMNGVGNACQTLATCEDGLDNDRDGRVDFPHDKGCESPQDSTETSSLIPCDDGADNDNDGLADFRTDLSGDPGCGWDTGSTTAPEDPVCDDGIDNNGDGLVDWDGNIGMSDPDPDCQGFGYGPSEVVPEPGFAVGLGIGCLAITLGGSRLFV